MTNACLAALLILANSSAIAQMPALDTPVRRPDDPVTQRYLIDAGRYARLFNGPEYTAVYSKTLGTAFFGDKGFQTGSVNYEGTVYAPVSIAIDVVTGQALIRDSASNIIALLPEKLLGFTIGNNNFINLQPRQAAGIPLRPGIYEVHDFGTVSVWTGLQKKVQRGFKAEDPDHFVEYYEYFVRTGSGFSPITNESSLMRVFGKEAGQVNALMDKSGMRFRSDKAAFIRKAAEFYGGIERP